MRKFTRDESPQKPVHDRGVPDGWTRTRWIERLRELADLCEPLVPDRAKFLREWASELELKDD